MAGAPLLLLLPGAGEPGAVVVVSLGPAKAATWRAECCTGREQAGRKGEREEGALQCLKTLYIKTLYLYIKTNLHPSSSCALQL